MQACVGLSQAAAAAAPAVSASCSRGGVSERRIVRQMLSLLGKEYRVTFEVGEPTSDHDTERVYYPVSFTQKIKSSTDSVYCAKYFPPGPESIRTLLVYIYSSEDRWRYVQIVMQEVSEDDGRLLNTMVQLTAVELDWRDYFKIFEMKHEQEHDENYHKLLPPYQALYDRMAAEDEQRKLQRENELKERAENTSAIYGTENSKHKGEGGEELAIIKFIPDIDPNSGGRSSFIFDTRMFAPVLEKRLSASRSVVQWPDVLLLLPVILRSSSPPLLLVPRDRIQPITTLLHDFAKDLGLSHFRVGTEGAVDVLVDSPETAVPRTLKNMLLVFQADELLRDSKFGRRVERFIEDNSWVGMHFSSRTKAVECILDREEFHFLDYPLSSPDRNLTGRVDDGKVDSLCAVLKPLKRPVAVLCNSAVGVVRLAEELRMRGFEAWGLCSGTEESLRPNIYKGRSPVLVTDVYGRFLCQTIIFERGAGCSVYVRE